MTTTHVATDSFVEYPEAVRHEVPNVREVEEGQRDPDQCVQDRDEPAKDRLWCDVPVTCQLIIHELASYILKRDLNQFNGERIIAIQRQPDLAQIKINASLLNRVIIICNGFVQ